jgi:cytidylate kinase
LSALLEAIAIDGPAGAGKSTVAKIVAAELGFQYLDTGAMYRSAALLALRAGVALDDEDACAEVARKMEVRFVPGNPQRVLLDGEDVTEEIRTEEVSNAASVISVHPPVRREMVRRQRALCEAGKVVLEGRDTTTVVCPDARLKVFLTASPEERARRRLKDLLAAGEQITFEEVLEQIRDRDTRDMTREHSPLRVAEDALVVDTDGITAEEAARRVLEAWRAST